MFTDPDIYYLQPFRPVIDTVRGYEAAIASIADAIESLAGPIATASARQDGAAVRGPDAAYESARVEIAELEGKTQALQRMKAALTDALPSMREANAKLIAQLDRDRTKLDLSRSNLRQKLPAYDPAAQTIAEIARADIEYVSCKAAYRLTRARAIERGLDVDITESDEEYTCSTNEEGFPQAFHAGVCLPGMEPAGDEPPPPIWSINAHQRRMSSAARAAQRQQFDRVAGPQTYIPAGN